VTKGQWPEAETVTSVPVSIRAGREMAIIYIIILHLRWIILSTKFKAERLLLWRDVF